MLFETAQISKLNSGVSDILLLQIILLEIAEKGMGLHRKFVCGCFAVDGDSLFYSVWWNAYKGIKGLGL